MLRGIEVILYMFFHKKENKEEVLKPTKKVYDFENDKKKKVDISALFDASNGKTSDTKPVEEIPEIDTKKNNNSTVGEFVIDLSNNDISKISEVQESSNDSKEKNKKKSLFFKKEFVAEEDDDVEEDDESESSGEFVEFEDEDEETINFGKIFKTIFATMFGIFVIVSIWALN